MGSSWDFGGGSSSESEPSWGDLSSQGQPTSQPPQDANLTEPAGPVASSRPSQLIWLIVALALAIGSVVAALLTDSIAVAIVGWLVAGPVAIGLLAVYVSMDGKQRAMPWYAVSPGADWGRRLLIVLSLVAVGLHAWTIADYIARGGPS